MQKKQIKKKVGGRGGQKRCIKLGRKERKRREGGQVQQRQIAAMEGEQLPRVWKRKDRGNGRKVRGERGGGK